jgi:hypothetical protein
MKSDPSVKTLPRKRRVSPAIIRIQEPMVNPELLGRLSSQGTALKDINIDCLKLKGCESKKLYSLGIFNLEQLGNTSESTLRAVPHFGILKVRRLKTQLNAYLLSLLSDVNPLPENQSVVCHEEQPEVHSGEDDSQLSSTFEFITSELEAASESLEKLKKRVHLFAAQIRKTRDL